MTFKLFKNILEYSLTIYYLIKNHFYVQEALLYDFFVFLLTSMMGKDAHLNLRHNKIVVMIRKESKFWKRGGRDSAGRNF